MKLRLDRQKWCKRNAIWNDFHKHWEVNKKKTQSKTNALESHWALESHESGHIGHKIDDSCRRLQASKKPAAAAAKSLQSCPTLGDPIDGSPPGSDISGILQARTLEWVAISFSNAWKWKVKVKSLSPVQLLATPWTAAYQAPPFMGFSRQECWSGLPLPSLLNKTILQKWRY